MDEIFQRILSKTAQKSGRSRLEPYGELIEQLRQRGLTYRDISDILARELQLQVPKSTVNDFVRAQARRRRNEAQRLSRRESASTPAVPTLSSPPSTRGPRDEEVRRRIAALKARKRTEPPPSDDFHFDPDEPLRLINPAKRDSYD